VRNRAVVLSAALWLVVGPAKSQMNNGGNSTLKGEIETAGSLHGYTVQLYDVSRHATLATSDIRADGGFEYNSLPAGSYFVTVANERGDEVYHGSVNVGGPAMAPLVIQLPRTQPATPVSGMISVRQLQHAPSRKAFQAMVQAQRFSEAGDFAKAAASLEKAVVLSPDFADAHGNLGAQYLHLGRYAEAIGETERAIELDGPSTPRLCNLAFAQLHLGQDAEALGSVRAALRLKADDAHAHYIMGVILFLNHAPMDEVRAHLETAGRTLPGAKADLERIATAH
jgi:tetratricopeptide (TPR) repeat protein